MVLRYFRKSEKPPAQDTDALGEPAPPGHSNSLHDTPAAEQGTDKVLPQSSIAEQTPSNAQNEPTSALLPPSTEVSRIDVQGQIERPILSDEDESFLRRIVSEDDNEAPPLPPRPLPEEVGEGDGTSSKPEASEKKAGTALKDRWTQYWDASARNHAADDLMSAAEALKTSSEPASEAESEVKQEQKDVKTILQKLDLSAINNRVVGVSHDTQALLESFNQVLKDLINGVPTAYNDLENLLKDREAQLDKLFGTLPPFLQKLVKSIPTKMYAYVAPQVAAAMNSRKSKDEATSDKDESEKPKTPPKKHFLMIPSLKELVMRKGAVVAMLRSIISFLETRFPAILTGTNVVMSLAVFVLLFVFWYCHKRGRETRLARETSDSLESSTTDLEAGIESEETPETNEAVPEKDVAISNASDAELERKVNQLAQEIEKKP